MKRRKGRREKNQTERSNRKLPVEFFFFFLNGIFHHLHSLLFLKIIESQAPLTFRVILFLHLALHTDY